MKKYCSKCQKEIPQKSKNNLCENCQNKTNGRIRIFAKRVLTIVGTVGTLALYVLTKGKIGGPKA